MSPQERLKYIDTKDGLARIRGNTQVYQKLMRSFLGKDLLGEMQAQLAAGSIELAERAVHAIKGTAGNLSMPALFVASTALDIEMKAGIVNEQAVAAFAITMDKTREAAQDVLDCMSGGGEL